MTYYNFPLPQQVLKCLDNIFILIVITKKCNSVALLDIKTKCDITN